MAKNWKVKERRYLSEGKSIFILDIDCTHFIIYYKYYFPHLYIKLFKLITCFIHFPTEEEKAFFHKSNEKRNP